MNRYLDIYTHTHVCVYIYTYKQIDIAKEFA